MVINMSHEDKERYKNSIKPKELKVRKRRTTILSAKGKELALKDYQSYPTSENSTDLKIDEHVKMNDNWMRTGPYKPKSK